MQVLPFNVILSKQSESKNRFQSLLLEEKVSAEQADG